MTLDEMMNDKDAQAFFANFEVEVEVEETYKGYCPECEHYVCHCEEYNLA